MKSWAPWVRSRKADTKNWSAEAKLQAAADRLEGCRSLSPDVAIALNEVRGYLRLVDYPYRSRSWEQHRADVERLRLAGFHDAANYLDVKA